MPTQQQPSIVFESESELAAAVFVSLEQDLVVGLYAGDLLDTVAGHPNRPANWLYPMDLAVIVLDHGDPVPFVSYATVGRPLGKGPAWTYLNATNVAGVPLGVKAHPNDGKIDQISSSLGRRQSRLAKQRASLGSYLPHPDIDYTQGESFQGSSTKKKLVVCDGQEITKAKHWKVSVVRDAFRLVI